MLISFFENLKSFVNGYKLTTILRAIILGYITFTVLYKIYWHIRARRLISAAKKFGQMERNKVYKFKNVAQENLILTLTATELKEHLLKGTFTSDDLVNVFGKRCYEIGYRYNFTA